MDPTIKIVENPGPWLQGGALGVLFAVMLVVVLCIVVPMVGVAVWSIRYFATHLVDEIRQLRIATMENTAVMREVSQKQDIIIDAIAAPEAPRPLPSANGHSHHETQAIDEGR